jgi:hypothetical protein
MKTPHVAGHTFDGESLRRIPWVVCRCCGLVYLRNERTAKAIKAGCEKGQETP